MYQLGYGATLKVKLVLVRVIQSKDSYDVASYPAYAIMSTNVVHAIDLSEGAKPI